METVFRIDSDHGAWCSLLLPLTYTVISFKTLPKSYTLIVTSLLFGAYSIFLAISCDVLFRNTREKKSTEYIKRKASKFGIQNYAVITVLGLMLYSWLPIQEAILVCMCLTAYIFYLPRMFLTFQKSFTFGEGCLALQSLLLFVASSVQSFWSSFDRTVSIPSGYSTIAQIGLLSLILLCSIPVLTGLNWNPVLFYLTGAVIIGCFTIPFLWIKIQSDPVTWLTISVVDSPSRLKLIGIWLLCIFGAVLVVVRQLWNGEQATTSVRKYFHFFVVIVFTTGVYIDCELLFLSSVIVLCVQLLLEYVRALQIGPIAAYLDQDSKVNKMYSWLVVPVRILRILIDFLTNLIYGWIYEGDRVTRLPPIQDVVLLDPATVLADKIRTQKITSVEVLEVYFKRINEVNGDINCLVDSRFDEALLEAEAADLEIKSCQDLEKLKREKPFLGVPFTTKDCFAVTGLSYTAGLAERGRRKVKADFDADAIVLMRKAGAIPIGVTNVSELCMWMESSNQVYGRSNNPYHLGRIVGGSSGGEAALIASGGSVFGVGSDVGGSIRMPAFFCGIFGHKPTVGLISNAGQIPKAVGLVNTFLTTGPLCRYASDLKPMFEVLLLNEVRTSNLLRLDVRVDLKKIKLYYMEDDGGSPFGSPVHKELKASQLKLVETLARVHGMAAPKKVSIELFKHSFKIWSHKMSSERSAPSFCAALNEYKGEINPFLEFAKWCCYKSSKHTLPALGLGIFEKFFSESDPNHAIFLGMCDQLRDELELLLGDDGVLVYPSHPTPAPYHGQPLLKLCTLAFNFPYTGIFNMTGNPVTQVPLGLGSWGVPLGAQLVCGRNQDRLGLALALEVEKLFGGWVPPSGIQ